MKAFISYTREKDQYGVVSAFRERLLNELRLRRKSAEIFLDTTIPSGTSFPQAIRDALAGASVLIVLLSPAWMESEWCRRELEDFVDIKSGAGKFPYVLPLLWVKTELGGYPNDRIADFLAPLQYRDWRDLRKKKWESEELRDELDSLAEALFELARVSD